MANGEYSYAANEYKGMHGLVRFGDNGAEMFVAPGVWKRAPHLDAMSYGGGAFMDYDDITPEKAAVYEAEARERFAKMRKA